MVAELPDAFEVVEVVVELLVVAFAEVVVVVDFAADSAAPRCRCPPDVAADEIVEVAGGNVGLGVVSVCTLDDVTVVGPTGGSRRGGAPPSRTDSTEASLPSIPSAHTPMPRRFEFAASCTLRANVFALSKKT